MFCKNCGSELKGTEMFCTKCGAAVKLPQNLVQTPIPQMGIKPDDTRKTRRVPVKLFVAAGICLVVLITAVATTMHVTSPQYRYRKSVKQAQKQMDGGNYEEALKLYETASRYLPKESEAKEGQIQAKLGMAGVAYQKGEYQSALEIYEAVLGEEEDEEAAKGRVDCYLGLADAAFAANDHEQAKSCYESALRFDKTRAEGYIGLADILLAREDGVIPAMELLKEGGEFCASGVLEEKRQYIKEHTSVTKLREAWYYEFWTDGLKIVTETEYDPDGKEVCRNSYEERNGVFYDFISAERYEYDLAGKLTKEETYEGDELRWWTYYEYDSAGKLTGKSYNDAVVGDVYETYEYDAEGREIKGTRYWGKDANRPAVGWWEREYDAQGRETRYFYHGDEPNDDYGGNISGGYEREYDALGNEIKHIYLRWNGTYANWEEWEYDEAGNRVKGVSYSSDGSASWAQKYEYDPMGNVLFFEVDSQPAKYTEYAYQYVYAG